MKWSRAFVLWGVINVIYLFGYYAGYRAVVWWSGLPFVGTSLVAVLVFYRRGWRAAQRQDDAKWEDRDDAAEWRAND
jgi:hypothetical protein